PGPGVVHLGVEDEAVEQDVVPGIEVEVDDAEQGGGQEDDGQGNGNGQDGGERGGTGRGGRGLAFAGPAIYCHLVSLTSSHPAPPLRIPQAPPGRDRPPGRSVTGAVAAVAVLATAVLAPGVLAPAPAQAAGRAPARTQAASGAAAQAVKPGAVVALVLPVV